MKLIIEKWGNKHKSPDNFLFPVFEAGLTPLRQYELAQLFVCFINEWMKRIAYYCHADPPLGLLDNCVVLPTHTLLLPVIGLAVTVTLLVTELQFAVLVTSHILYVRL